MPIVVTPKENELRKASLRSWKDARSSNFIERPVVQPAVQVQPKTEELINKDYNTDLSRLDPNETYLVHKGHIKLISKKSKYLLDMLIIEEEN